MSEDGWFYSQLRRHAATDPCAVVVATDRESTMPL